MRSVETFDLARDAATPVLDHDDRVSFQFTGKLRTLTVKLGPSEMSRAEEGGPDSKPHANQRMHLPATAGFARLSRQVHGALDGQGCTGSLDECRQESMSSLGDERPSNNLMRPLFESPRCRHVPFVLLHAGGEAT